MFTIFLASCLATLNDFLLALIMGCCKYDTKRCSGQLYAGQFYYTLVEDAGTVPLFERDITFI